MRNRARFTPSMCQLLLIVLVALPVDAQGRRGEGRSRATPDTGESRRRDQLESRIRTPGVTEAPVAGDAVEVQGAREGIYHVYPGIMRIRLDLTLNDQQS